ncbi:hypothetical protein [Nonomuraea mesophila]|uniref:hypothetical protein n=1 Tax=Nonomuraea mesophila TaxID=2530382 RepID=UPI00104AA70C|nr:hypothetical protein [Nonomuraea mesophila]
MYLGWAEDHREWVDTLTTLQKQPEGFSFTVANPRPGLSYTYDKDTYLHRTRKAELAAAQKHYDNTYKALRDKYEAGLADYLAIGEEFLKDVTDPVKPAKYKRALMIDAQRHGHLMHNAAVLWLEAHPTAKLDGYQDYEELLKTLWVGDLREAHPEWIAGKPTKRQQQLLLYCLGRDDLGTVPLWNDPPLADVRKKSHVTLGKVILSAGAPTLPVQRLHPSYWGLFLVSPLHGKDRGFYEPEPGDVDDRWIQRLSKDLRMESRRFRHEDSKFQVYEVVPRPVEDPTFCSTGVYLHRSNAHGRDDFLTVVPDKAVEGQTPLVFCTKGVGADPDHIGSPTARVLTHVGRMRARFGETTTTDFPFAYPGSQDTGTDTAGSWRNIGFCNAYGGDEIAIADFLNFAVMYEKAAAHALTAKTHGFVRPIALVEISNLPRNLDRMPDLRKATSGSSPAIGYPAQIVTCSPVETSLRIYKQGHDQDYVYYNLDLELAEWERCYTNLVLPPGVVESVEEDIKALDADIRAYAKLQGLVELEEGLPDRLRSLQRRMLLAYKIMWQALLSWWVFLDNRWASDTYTGSFSGRNFNSGPRDSNEWGPLDRPSEDQTPGKGGEGQLCLHIDLSNLGNLCALKGELQTMLELIGPDMDAETRYEGKWIWKDCRLYSFSVALAQILGRAKSRLDSDIWPAAQKVAEEERAEQIAQALIEGLKADTETVLQDGTKGKGVPPYAALLPWR